MKRKCRLTVPVIGPSGVFEADVTKARGRWSRDDVEKEVPVYLTRRGTLTTQRANNSIVGNVIALPLTGVGKRVARVRVRFALINTHFPMHPLRAAELRNP